MPDYLSVRLYYRPLLSIETTTSSVVNDLREMMDEGKSAILVLVNLKAAFDTEVHELLLNDLKGVEVVDCIEISTKLFRRQKLLCPNWELFSSFEALIRGVPQGSVLEPILFCINMTGLSKVLQRYGVQFK